MQKLAEFFAKEENMDALTRIAAIDFLLKDEFREDVESLQLKKRRLLSELNDLKAAQENGLVVLIFGDEAIGVHKLPMSAREKALSQISTKSCPLD